jgi:hypothetical protein
MKRESKFVYTRLTCTLYDCAVLYKSVDLSFYLVLNFKFTKYIKCNF